MTQISTTNTKEPKKYTNHSYVTLPMPGIQAENIKLPERLAELSSSDSIIRSLQRERAVLARCLKRLESGTEIKTILVPALKKFNPNSHFEKIDSSSPSKDPGFLAVVTAGLTKTVVEGALIGAVFESLSSQSPAFFESFKSGVVLSVVVSAARTFVSVMLDDSVSDKFLDATSTFRRSLSVLLAGINGTYSTARALLDVSKAKFSSSERQAKTFLAPYEVELRKMTPETGSRFKEQIKQYMVARQEALDQLLSKAASLQTISSAWVLSEMLHGYGKPAQSFVNALTSGLVQLSNDNYRQLIGVGLEKFVAERELVLSEPGNVALESCKRLKGSLTEADWKVACEVIDFRLTAKIPGEK